MTTELQMTGDQTVPMSLSAKDDAGNVITDGLATLTGFAWSEDSGGSVLTIVPAEDGLTAQVTANGPAGAATVTCAAAMADGTPISGACVVTVAVGAVADLAVVVGEPVHK